MCQKKSFKSNGGKRNPGFKAFTLIELLVVVAIIAVLVAILLPAIQKSRKQAKILACSTQMRQIGVGLYAYATENQDFFPLACKGSSGLLDWGNLPAPLEKIGAILEPRIYFCPDGSTWYPYVQYPQSVGRLMGYNVRWGIHSTAHYSLRDPDGIVLVTEPCGWWAAWSHSPHRDAQGDSGFNRLFLDGSVEYQTAVSPLVAEGLSSMYGYDNWWRPLDRIGVPQEWYNAKGD